MLLSDSELTSTNLIHIIAPFVLGNGGDWHAIDLYLQYSKTHRVMLWSHNPPLSTLKAQYPIQEIKPYSGLVPNQGVLIISGARTEVGHWFESGNFDHVILLHNLLSPTVLYKALNRLTRSEKKPEIVYVSDLVKRFAGLPGRVVYHIPPKERFQPETRTHNKKRKFTVGRMSTDTLSKHHFSDKDVYLNLVKDNDIQIRIIGGTCLTPWLGNQPSINLLPTVPQTNLPAAYNDLDCFYYRVANTVKDAFPIVVMEAMLSGLPVVCHRDVGSIEVIQHGINGFVFDTQEEAINIIKALKNNANLRTEIGMHANLTAETLRD